MSSTVRLTKKLPDGRYIFCREGVYFTMTREQVETLIPLVEEYEKSLQQDPEKGLE